MIQQQPKSGSFLKMAQLFCNRTQVVTVLLCTSTSFAVIECSLGDIRGTTSDPDATLCAQYLQPTAGRGYFVWMRCMEWTQRHTRSLLARASDMMVHSHRRWYVFDLAQEWCR